MKASSEFKVGKNGIGYVNDRFKELFVSTEFDARPMPTFQKLLRNMKDVEIEYEFKPGFSSLGDVFAFIKNAPEECKDGWSNLFYLPSCVVNVFWGGGGWGVGAWYRDGSEWGAGLRVFAGAKTFDTESLSAEPSETLSLGLEVISVTRIVNGKGIMELECTMSDGSIWLCNIDGKDFKKMQHSNTFLTEKFHKETNL